MEYLNKITIPKKEQLSTEEIERLHSFYTVEFAAGSIKNIHIDRLRMIEKLRELGYLRYDMEDGNSEYVHITDNKIELTTEQKIKDAFEDYILSLPVRVMEREVNGETTQITIKPRQIQEQLYKNMQSYFSCIDRLRPNFPIELQKDTKTEKYFFFENTAVSVTASGIIEIPYKDLDRYIWENSVLTRPFHYTTEKGDYEKFIEDISGTDDAQRKASLMSLLGYLMHDFYECDLTAVLFTDVNKENAGKAAGGTGKGLLGKALSEMLNRRKTDCKYCVIGGKTIDLTKDTRYALADVTTQLIHLEDLGQFKFNVLYNDITDGATIRKPYQVRPIVRYIKMMLSVNHTLELDGSSDMRRLIIFELANYYSDKFRPQNKFKKRFFESEWTSTDWNQFYSFMCRCVQVYLANGIIHPSEVNYSERRLAESINEDFRYWFEDLIKNNTLDNSRAEFVKNTIYEQFATKYPAYYERRYRNAFTKWCRKFLELKHIPYCELRSTNDILIIYPTREDFLKQK